MDELKGWMGEVFVTHIIEGLDDPNKKEGCSFLVLLWPDFALLVSHFMINQHEQPKIAFYCDLQSCNDEIS
jgi:hypothetical protein